MRSEETAKLANSTTTATGNVTTISAGIPSPTPTKATATSRAAISPRRLVSSTRSPAKPSRAGSRVSEASSVNATTTAMPIAMPETKPNCMISMPSSEMTTVEPANTTARPAVFIAISVDCSMLCPVCRFSRNRVTMNKA